MRRRRLEERYPLLWIVTGAVLLVLGVWRDALGVMAELMGIANPPSALFVLASLSSCSSCSITRR
jgi:hypothetical protein